MYGIDMGLQYKCISLKVEVLGDAVILSFKFLSVLTMIKIAKLCEMIINHWLIYWRGAGRQW